MPGFKDINIPINHGTASNGFGLNIGSGGISLSGNFNTTKPKKVTQSAPQTSALRDLYKKKETATFQFPKELSDDRYMMIRCIERVNEKNGTQKENTKRNFVFPIPTNLNPQYSVDYNNEPMGALGSMASGMYTMDQVTAAAGDIFNRGAAGFSKFGKIVGGDIQATEGEKTLGLSAAIGAVVTAAGGAGAGILGAGAAAAIGGVPQVISGAMSQAGVAFNSHMAVLFSGVGFRTFQFNYRFIPKTADESQELHTIIKLLKRSMYPSLPATNKFLFNYPDEFRIDFAEPLKPYLFETKRMVLKDMSVNYNGDGVPRFFDDNSPVVVDIQMTFQEVEILTSEDFGKDTTFENQQLANIGSDAF